MEIEIKNAIYISTPKIFKYNSNKINARSIWGKQQNSDEKSKNLTGEIVRVPR